VRLLFAALLGIVQGVTEFLPISSTAHLLLIAEAVGFDDPGGVFTVMIQLGSIFAVVWVYRARLLGAVAKIDFDDLTELVPAFTTVVVMVFTFNIANGLTAGLVLYPVMKVLSGRARELSAGAIVLGVLCSLYYVFGVPH